jgi:nucleotide-binding universal stress UspA family protein
VAKRILVPLDRSAASEAVLPIVADMVRNTGGSVRLLTVQPEPTSVVADYGRVVAYADQEMARLNAEGDTYLQGAAARLDGVPVERVVRFGEPVAEILLEAEAWDADLIVMVGPTPAWRPRWRRVPVEVARRATVPVLVQQTPSQARRAA